MLTAALLALSLLPEGLAGPHPVGSRVLGERDPARRLEGAARPVQIGLWYPASVTPATPLSFGEYVALAASERSLAKLTPTEGDAARAQFRRFLASNGVPAAAASRWLAAGMLARADAPAASGRFPLVLVAQGNGQAAPEQAVLAELLASHGFVVATSPSQIRLGSTMGSEEDVLPSAREQARGLAFVRTRVLALPFVADAVAWIGHSFGARSALLAALAEPRTAALVSLDGGIGAAAAKGWLAKDRSLDPTSLRVPLLHLYEDVDPMMAPDFDLLESIRFAPRRLVKVQGLTHRHFTSYGWAVAAIPELEESSADLGGLCQAVALETPGFLKKATSGAPAEPAAPLPGLRAINWFPDTATRSAVRGPASRLRIDDGGAAGKTPVVFVHGNGAALMHWSESLAYLRAKRQAVAFDLRGNGESQPVRDARYEVADVAKDVGAVADALGLTRFVLVGHSFGGCVVEAYAAAHPERVAGLLLVDPAGDVGQAPAAGLDRYLALLRGPEYAKASRAALQQSLQGAAEGVSERVLGALAEASPEAFASCFDGLRRFDPALALRAYAGPVLAALQARREDDATSVHKLVPGLPYKTLAGVSHFLMMDDPARFDALLDEFLSKVDSSVSGGGAAPRLPLEPPPLTPRE